VPEHTAGALAPNRRNLWKTALTPWLLAGATLFGGLWYGTYVAGGPDSYCYLNQAELFVSRRVRDPQPIIDGAQWPERIYSVVPVGHVPAPSGDLAVVPMCPPGYPVMLALARIIAGRTAMFWVVPMLGAIAVWCTFVIGRRVAGATAGVIAALLLAASPAFLYQIVQPMSDVPAAAAWAVALVVALRPPGFKQALLCGAATGAALFIRPNLAPLGLVMAGMLVAASDPGRATSDARRPGWSGARPLIAFALGGLPFFVALLALQNATYGGPLTSGYGALQLLFSVDHIGPNLARYPVWLIETQTPAVLLALAAPWLVRPVATSRIAWWLLAFVLVTFACYLPYVVYDAWWFLRFLLPAWPPMLALTAAVLCVALSRHPAPGEPGGQTRLSPAGSDPFSRRLLLLLITASLVIFQLFTAERRAVFRLHELERRYRDGGEYVARKLPANAVVFTTQQSGSVRFYSGRPTIVWDSLDPAWLDRALDYFRTKGYEPFFLFEFNEESEFRKRFGPTSRIGNIEWPPFAQIDRDVRIFALADDERYRRGEKIETDFVYTKR
jgi:hypothetical protein